ncbi:MAG: hypothetical protein Q8Q42_00300 [Nanoarchaeota archaeon]|nr:hypothetical protein [Nanoarchaeota archaeon]
MNNKKLIQSLIFGLLIILGTALISAAPAIVAINAPATGGFNSGAVTVNISITGAEGNVTNVTLNIYDSSNTLVFYNLTNGTNENEGNISEFQWVWDANNGTFSDGVYTINVTASENITSTPATNLSNGTISITVDNTAPNSSTSLTGDNGNTVGGTVEVDYGTAVNIDCNVVDSTAGLVSANNTISIKFPGLSTYENLTLTDNDATNLKAVVKAEQTRVLGDYSIRCFSWDRAGNSNLSEFNFTTKEVVIKGSGSAAIPGFENPVGKVKITSGVHTVKEKLNSDGVSFLLKKSAAVRLDINADYHTIEVKKMSADEVTVLITSSPIELTISAGESKTADLNGDGISDLDITYHKLFVNTYADMTFKLVETPVETTDDKEDTTEVFDTPDKEDTYKSPRGGLTVTLAVIVIVLIIGYALIKGKKK